MLRSLYPGSARLDRLAGAIHVLEISAKEIPDSSAPQGKYTNYFSRLVEVETGVVAATVVYRVY